MFWKWKQYEESFKYLKLAQKYIHKILKNELPQKSYTFEKVQEEDEETEREPSPCKEAKKTQNQKEK